jgi:hypothetical protein
MYPLHPSLPRRPDRTAERVDSRGRPIQIKVHYARELAPGFVQEISTSNDRLHIRRLRDGARPRAIRFSLEEIEASGLERAIEVAEGPEGPAATNVGTLVFPFGGRLEVGAAPGRVLLRITFRGKVTDHSRIEGAGIQALKKAIHYFKTAARRSHFEEGNER